MISPIPAYIALPAIVIVTTITVARWAVLRESTVDRLINRSLTWAVVGMLLHERAVAPTIASLLHQLSLGAILFTLAGIFGLAQLWRGADPETTWQRQRRYDAAIAVVLGLVLGAGTPARSRSMLIDQALGWPSVVFWAVFGTPLAVCAVLILRLGIREFRTEDLSIRERLVFYAIFAAAGGLLVDAVAGPLVAAFHTVTGIPSPDPQMIRKAATFFASALTASMITAIPLIAHILSRLGWDQTGRTCRRLRPLWRDLTDASRDIRLYTAAELTRTDPAVRLHRMTVEIRDALMQLRPYVPADIDPRLHCRDCGAVGEYALRIAHALDAKQRGAQPEPTTTQSVSSTASTIADLDSELRNLLELARDWPHAQARVASARSALMLRPHRPSKEQSR
ncbi:MAB_1171c family putative transporter [Nocardia sp. NPDC052566]|uniref:MAB_1171c family putative transporter n=1 Tax=Nocardia sp. NPDC052566 TaxID=3364330 RepID=UPI0037C7A0F7